MPSGLCTHFWSRPTPGRLDFARSVRDWHDSVPGLIVAEWVEGKID